MTEKETWRRYYNARVAYDNMPCYFNACAVLQYASELIAISDDYMGEYDEACDIIDGECG